jgi:protocatechuate 3,4-dioxygenase beta subunit
MLLSRRDLLAKCMAAGVLTSTANLLSSTLAHAWELSETARRHPTPAAELGPFYKKLAPGTNMLRKPGDPGMPLVVTGKVFDTRGDVVPATTVEVWQTNHVGLYDLEGYDYRAKLTANAEGQYDFSSVMPGHYPARVCQHVHYVVTAPGHKPLTTQLYFATDPVFEGDPDKNYTRDPLITSRELVRPVTLVGDPKDIHAAVLFELVLEVL